MNHDIKVQLIRTLFFNILIPFFLYGNASAQCLDPSLSPSRNFNLKAFYLQTLGPDNSFLSISNNELNSGYTSSFFYTDIDGAMVFKVPSNGATTSNSSYPRVELRQTGEDANWKIDDQNEHYIEAECCVVNIPTEKPKLIIGQIHGSESNSELLKLRWTGYEPGECFVEARFQTNDYGGSEYGVKLAEGLSLGDKIFYSLSMINGTINVEVNGESASQTYSGTYYGYTDRYYFKAGNYLQYESREPSIYGLVKFYKLSLRKGGTNANEEILASANFNVNLSLNSHAFEVHYQLHISSYVRITIYDLMGRMVATSNVENVPPGRHTEKINCPSPKRGMYIINFLSSRTRHSSKLFVL